MNDKNTWWNTLRHEGVLISPVVMDDWLKEGPIHVEDRAVDKLRQAYYRFADDPKRLREFLDAALQDFLGHAQAGVWRKEQDIPDRFKHQGKKPNRVLLNAGKEHQPRFLVLIDDEHVVDDQGNPQRLGLHSGRRKHADLLRLMRAADVKLGLFTNGHHFRLIYAGMDHESWAEWSTDAWFQGGDGRLALHGFFTLLGTKTLPVDTESDKNLLLAKIQESRDRQADLSHVMGTQIREAVEILLEELTDTLASHPNATDILAPLRNLKRSRDEELQALYQAAIRCIMRLVVQLYAESRALLPKQERLYYESYSIEGLYQLLRRAVTDGREEELRALRSAWPRLLASWRAIHDGSIHKDLQIQTYGGQLFKPYNEDPKDSVLAALAVLADPRVHVSDWAIHDVLQKLRIGKFKIGRGKWRPGPVDFSDLRTEYIGMMYEGLLDYDLREAREEDGGIVFLSIGDQPALPLKVLEAQSDGDLKTMLKEQGKKGKSKGADEETTEEEDEEELEAEGEAATVEEQAEEEPVEQTAQEAFQGRVMAWATRAVELGGLYGATPAKLKKLDVPEQKKLLASAARQLILKSIPPGGMYLVRWSGTRKGSGTFYTKPGLAVPTTVRTLEPLVYDNHEDREHRVVKRPEEILALKVCDPAMGSGSFLVAALRFLSQALKESFEKYVLPKVEAGDLKATETGQTAVGLLTERLLRNRHEDHSGERMESALKRAVVEHCIYGVDLNPLAVELGKLSLWIETMDPTLRFTFLDHKIKCGNSLIGAWRHQAHIYPLAAWDRDFGDGPKNPRTKRAKFIRKQVILPELKVWLDGWKLTEIEKKPKAAKVKLAVGQKSLFGAAQAALVEPENNATEEATKFKLERVATQTTFTPLSENESWESRRKVELEALSRIHSLADPKEQEDDYRRLVGTKEHRDQKYALDKWCAVWFWPIRFDEDAPLDQEPILGPREFYQPTQSPQVHDTIQWIASKYRFFHWEFEYPDVFGEGGFGFDAVVGNPPWETAKPQDNEFFTKYDPAYRTYGKQDGLKKQEALFLANGAIREELWDYEEAFKAQSNYVRSTHDLSETKPSGKDDQAKWLALTSPARVNAVGTQTPFAFQGGADLNLYKLFAELMCAVSRQDSRIGLICPTGIYLDFGARDLRKLFVEQRGLAYVVSFWNKDSLFAIPTQNTFCVVVTSGRILGKNQKEVIRCRFNLRAFDDWAVANDAHFARIPTERIATTSPRHGVIYEVESSRDVQILSGIYQSSCQLADVATYSREFDTSTDSGLFVNAKRVKGQVPPVPHGAIESKTGDVKLLRPVVQGRCVHQFSYPYQSLNLENSKWEPYQPNLGFQPKFWMPKETYVTHSKRTAGPKIAYRRTTQVMINPRSFIGAILPDVPTADSIFILQSKNVELLEPLLTVLNSFVFDWVIRFRLPGINLSWYILEESPIPIKWAEANRPRHAATQVPTAVQREDLDASVAELYGLSSDDMRWILRPDNPDPRSLWKDYRERLKILEATGHRGKWYTLEEARQIRRAAEMEVDF